MTIFREAVSAILFFETLDPLVEQIVFMQMENSNTATRQIGAQTVVPTRCTILTFEGRVVASLRACLWQASKQQREVAKSLVAMDERKHVRGAEESADGLAAPRAMNGPPAQGFASALPPASSMSG